VSEDAAHTGGGTSAVPDSLPTATVIRTSEWTEAATRPRQRRGRVLTAAAAIVAIAAVTWMLWPAPEFENGSFEDALRGWQVVGHVEVAVHDAMHPASDGDSAIVLNPNDETGVGSSLSRRVRTVAGQRYELVFDFGVTEAMADQILQVMVTGRQPLIDTRIRTAPLSSKPYYATQRLSFVADSAATTIIFADRSVTYVAIDGLLDNVRLQAVPGGRPLIAEAPSRLAVADGGDATFQVRTGGEGAVKYQWQFAGVDLDGATSDTLVIRAVTQADAGNYRVKVWNDAGTTISSDATLTVLPPALLLNGSFEYGSAAWTFAGTFVSTSTNRRYGVTDGVELAHFNWGQQPPNATISQAVKTEPGRAYALECDVGAFSLVNHDEQRMDITVTGLQTLVSRTVHVNAPADGAHYEHQRLEFVADSTQVTVAFHDVSTVTRNVDLLLDNVSLMVGPSQHRDH